MNPDTGKVYRSPEEVAAALRRGESVVEISERVAGIVADGHAVQSLGNKKVARIRNKAARRARKRNRR